MNSSHAAPIILGLEASGAHASAAVLVDGQCLSERRIDQKHGHASYFVTLAAECVAQAGYRFSDITHIAAGIGPGSFTGLRVCLAAAKGFVLAGALCPIGVHGLRARAFAAVQNGTCETGTIISLADTRRGSYFYQSYDTAYQPLDEIKEAELSDICDEAAQKKSAIIACPAQDQTDAISDEMRDKGILQMTDMTARHIASLAYYDISHNNPLLPLDALYVAEPKLGPKKAQPAKAVMR